MIVLTVSIRRPHFFSQDSKHSRSPVLNMQKNEHRLLTTIEPETNPERWGACHTRLQALPVSSAEHKMQPERARCIITGLQINTYNVRRKPEHQNQNEQQNIRLLVFLKVLQYCYVDLQFRSTFHRHDVSSRVDVSRAIATGVARGSPGCTFSICPEANRFRRSLQLVSRS